MNEEEKQAIEKLDYELTNSWVHNQGISKETLKLFKDIIEKQQKEIEKLKDELKEERNFNKSALETLKECVHKDKIKEKIKELESHIWKDGYMTKFDKYAIYYLKEILGE